ncbi:MAG: ComEC/Rec2 family competence protein [Ilumatobacteraceae bacterium]
MNQFYGVVSSKVRHKLHDHRLVLIALLLSIATRWWWILANVVPFLGHRIISLLLAGTVIVAFANSRPNRKFIIAVTMATVIVGASGAQDAWRHSSTESIGPYRGPALLRSDPEQFFGGQRVVLEVSGERFETVAYGSPARRIRTRLMGETVWIEGTRSRVRPDRMKWLAPRHVVGRLSLTSVSEQASFGPPLFRSVNRIRRVLIHGAGVMPDAEATLYLGLIIGDDRNQPESMRNAFRSAGLSHLVAVSGQNVAFVLIALGPLMRRLRTWWRLAATVGALVWFVLLTRIEPSVLRAATMAAMSAFGFARGLKVSPKNLLAFAVIVLIVVDPMLVWSIGFLMSVGATTGLIGIAPILSRELMQLRVPVWFAQPLSITIGAQLGVMPISLVVFHSAPVIGILANLLAVPVAGFVMLAGLPLGLLSAALPEQLTAFVMWPIVLAVRWVWWVAVIAERVSPPGVFNCVGWVAVVVSAIAWRCYFRKRSAMC